MKYRLILFLLLVQTKIFCKELPAGIINQTERIKQQLALYPKQDTIRARLLNLLAWELKSLQTDSALKYANEALTIYRKYNLPALTGGAEDNIGVIYQIKADYKQALLHHLQALEIGRKYNLPRLIASTEDNMGIIYQVKADYRQALFYHLQALRVYEKYNAAAYTAKALNNIGQVYFLLKKYEQSLEYYKRAIEFMERDTSSSKNESLCSYYNNIAGAYSELKQVGMAIFYYEKSNQMSLETNGRYNGIVCVNLAEIYSQRKNIAKAEYYSNKAFELSERDAYLRYLSYLSLGRVASLKGNYYLALQNLLTSLKISEKFGLLWNRAEIYQKIAFAYEKKKDFKKAYQYFKEYHEVSRKELNETMTKQVSEMQAKYEAGVKDEQIKRLSHAKEMVEADNEKSRLMSYFMILIFVSLSVIGIVIARNLILKQRFSNKVLSEKNAITQLQKEQIERANMELVAEKITAQYEVLKSKINPHFLFNSLSTLSSLIAKGKDSALFFVENFSELYRRILNTSEQKLISLDEEIEIVKRYLFLQQIEFQDNLSLEIEIDPLFMRKKIPPFALQMVVENAIKHNIISSKQPLYIKIHIFEENIIVENTLQPRRNKVESTGVAVKNIAARYGLVSGAVPHFEKLETIYRVKLPLLD